MESSTIPPPSSNEGTGAGAASRTPNQGPTDEAPASLKHDEATSDVSEPRPPEKSSKRKEGNGKNSSHARSKKVKVSNEVSRPKANGEGEGDDDEEAQPTKLLTRREANRIHAFKSRQRSKHLLQELQQLVTQYNYEKLELERQNAVLTAQVEVLQQQNMTLLQSHPPPQPPAPAFYAAPPQNSANLATQQWLQTLLQAVSGAQQPQQPQPWGNTATAPAAASTSWMMNMLLAAAAANSGNVAPVPATQPAWTNAPVVAAAPPAPREEWAPTQPEPQQQLQRAFQQAKEAPPAAPAEKPTLHPV